MTRTDFETHLRSADPFARASALLAFSQAGGSLSASRLLQLYLAEQDALPRTSILRFLICGSRDNTDFEATLMKLLSECSDCRRLEIFSAMSAAQRYPERLKETIVAIALGGSPEMKVAALDVLINYFPHRAETIQFVRGHLSDVDRNLRCSAAAFLFLHSTAERGDALRMIHAQLASRDEDDRCRMVLSLNHPFLSNKFKPDLIKLLDDESMKVQKAVAMMFWDSDLRCNSILFPSIKPALYRI